MKLPAPVRPSASLPLFGATFLFLISLLTASAQSGWVARDIGAVSPSGSSSVASDVTTVRGAGADIWGAADAFHFYSGSLSGDATIVTRVSGLTNTNSWAKAGVMFRDGLAANARNVLLLRTPSGTISFQYRNATGGASQAVTGSYGLAPAWLMLTRAGNVFTGYESKDGNAWRKVGAVEIALPTTAEAGLAVTSHANGTLATGTFDNIDIVSGSTGTTPPPSTDPLRPNAPSNLVCTGASASSMKLTWTDNAADETGFAIERNTSHGYITVATLPANATTWTDDGAVNPDGNPDGAGLRAGTTYFYTLRSLRGSQESLTVSGSGTTQASASTTAWTSADIGAVGVAGSMAQSGTSFTVRGSGADIWGASDAFQFVHQKLAFNGEIIARVASVTNTNNWAKAGVMFRANLTPGSAYALMLLTPGSGASFQFRTAAGAQSQMAGQDWGTATPAWVRLVRTGNTIAAYTSNDRSNWKAQGSATLDLPDEVYVGLAVTAHNNTTLNTAVFEQPAVLSATGQ